MRKVAGKVVDTVAKGTAALVYGARKNRLAGEKSDRQREAIVKGRSVPDSIIRESGEWDPAFRTKVNAINAKSEIEWGAAQGRKKLRAKYPK